MSLLAPNRQSVVAKYIGLHPDWAKDEALRGQIIDLAAAEANQTDGGAWGRKSRNPQGTDLNTDGMCFKRPDGLHEIYDAITGSGQSSWDAYGPFKAGENGYWVPASAVTPPPDPRPDPAPDKDLADVLIAIDAIRAELRWQRGDLNDATASLLALAKRIDALHAQPAPKYRVVGSTSRDYYHSHRINVTLEPEP